MGGKAGGGGRSARAGAGAGVNDFDTGNTPEFDAIDAQYQEARLSLGEFRRTVSRSQPDLTPEDFKNLRVGDVLTTNNFVLMEVVSVSRGIPTVQRLFMSGKNNADRRPKIKLTKEVQSRSTLRKIDRQAAASETFQLRRVIALREQRHKAANKQAIDELRAIRNKARRRELFESGPFQSKLYVTGADEKLVISSVDL